MHPIRELFIPFEFSIKLLTFFHVSVKPVTCTILQIKRLKKCSPVIIRKGLHKVINKADFFFCVLSFDYKSGHPPKKPWAKTQRDFSVKPYIPLTTKEVRSGFTTQTSLNYS